VPEYPNPAFVNRLPDDEFWAAKQVMSFGDEQIRAIVRVAEYSDPEAEAWVTQRLIERRDKIGRAFLTRVLPLDRFRIENGRLVFEDLAAKHGLSAAGDHSVQWSRFDNQSETKTPIPAATTFAVPEPAVESRNGVYFAADIRGGNPDKTVTVYLSSGELGMQVVGVDRTW
jgi:hypothetical protein